MSKLAEIRKERGLSQDALADLTGISASTIRAYEQKQRPIESASATTVYTIAKALCTTIEDLLELERLA